LGPVLIISDPVSGNVAISTAIMQMDTPGFITIRLKVEDGEITEIEHMVSTKRNLSAPPTPFGDVETYTHAPGMADIIPKSERASRERMIAIGDGYFQTLQRNNGKLHTRFAPNATRRENGLSFGDIEKISGWADICSTTRSGVNRFSSMRPAASFCFAGSSTTKAI